MNDFIIYIIGIIISCSLTFWLGYAFGQSKGSHDLLMALIEHDALVSGEEQ